MDDYVIIVAGGQGTRMQSDTPKQFIELSGKPVLMHSIEAFAQYNADIDIVVVLPAQQITFWRDLCSKYQFPIKHRIVEGGNARFHSVKNGLQALPDSGLVAIHDGVRPLVDQVVIERCFHEAAQYGNAVPVTEVIDSVREISNTTSQIIDRKNLRLIQTPQVFDLMLLKKAYNRDYLPEFTDDASVFECDGHTIRLVTGSDRNIKITTPRDLMIAQWLIGHD